MCDDTGFNGFDRRAPHDDGTNKLVMYRLEKVEKDIEKFDTKLTTVVLDITTMKSELQHAAKSEARFSGTITGVIMGVIGLFIQAVWKLVAG